MTDTLDQMVKLERANYAAMLPIAQVTPGVEVVIRDDVILTSSQTFPAPDTTHACLLRTTDRAAEDLITQVNEYFESRSLPTTIFISPACAPAAIAERLLKRGFVRQETEEAWLVLENLPNFALPRTIPGVCVRQITEGEAEIFASTFMTAFDLPGEFAPYLAQLLEPCLNLPGVYHYLAFIDGQSIGTCSLLCQENFGILGSVGVAPAYRRSGAATNLATRAAMDAQAQGVDTLILQTTAGGRLERLLRISGFKTAFTRNCYSLP